jgi:ribonuclease P protein component
MTQREPYTPAPVRHTLKGYERLKLKKQIDTLFSLGKAYSVLPITIKYLVTTRSSLDQPRVLTGFTVPKKRFKRAVKRNRIKRLMREAWRIHKAEIRTSTENQQLHVFLIYTGTELLSFNKIETAILKSIEKLNSVLL